MAAVVIVGAGIIGTSTAYYLSELKPKAIHLVESSPELFASASGKAGGFLAADWFSSSVAPLGELSFKLHKELAERYQGREKWGYTSSTGTSYADTPRKPGSKKGEDWLLEDGSRAEVAGEHDFKDGSGPAWLTRRNGDSLDFIGKDATCAQLDPLRLCQYLLSECQKRGVQLHHPAEAVSTSQDASGRLSGVRIRNRDTGAELEIEATHILITAGAWSPRVFQNLFPESKVKIPVSQLAGHSLVVRSPRWTSEHEKSGAHAIFATTEEGLSPEMFSRIGGEIYISGLNDSALALPEKPTDAKSDDESVMQLKKVAEKMLGLAQTGKSDLEIVRQGLCFRPITNRGTPILTRIEDEKLGGVKTEGGAKGGVFVATGHGPWGIALSLGTGVVMSELMMGEKTTADISGLAL